MRKSLKQEWEQLKTVLQPMTTAQKLDHLWTYYKSVLLIALVAVVIVSVVITGVINANMDVLISGAIVNTQVDAEGYIYLSDGYFAHKEGVKGKQEVRITSVIHDDPFTTQDIEYTYNATLRIVAMVNAQELDYMLMDSLGMEYYMGQDLFMDLGEIFTPEELELLHDDLIFLHYEETGEVIPVAVNIQNTGFFRTYLQGVEEPHYIGFLANTLRPEACREFWDFLQIVPER